MVTYISVSLLIDIHIYMHMPEGSLSLRSLWGNGDLVRLFTSPHAPVGSVDLRGEEEESRQQVSFWRFQEGLMRSGSEFHKLMY